MIWKENSDSAKKSKELQELNERLFKEEQAEKEVLKQKEINDSFYQRLADGLDTNILIVGDSIAQGTGASTKETHWSMLLEDYLEKNYNVNITTTNISMGGNASYAGYVRTMALNDDVNYNLAIICYGHNDKTEGFSTEYESIIRAIRNKYPECSIVSILESSQKEYTEKMEMIQSICKHYGVSVVDTIAAFNNSEKNYEELTADGVHPNDEGQKIYFEAIRDVIDENVGASTGKMKDVSVINEDVHKYDNFIWYDANSDFNRIEDTTFVIDVSASGIMGIDYTYESGDNKADIYVDGELFESPTVTFDYDFSQRHILVVSDDCTVKKEIKITFSTKEQADGFRGICFSWK